MSSAIPKQKAPIGEQIRRVFNELPQDALYITPRDLAPICGITEFGVLKHCRDIVPASWRGGFYRFLHDDPEHMQILRNLVRSILTGGRKLPPALTAA